MAKPDAPSERYAVGDTPVRVEDERLLRGQGRYLDDIEVDGLAHGVVLRSPWAHAHITRVDGAAAQAMPGVLAVLTGADQAAAGIGPTWPHARANVQTGEPFPCEPQPILAIDRVRYVGEAIAFVVAETREQALDAAERIAVDHVPLPAVVSPGAARADDAPRLSEAVPANTCLDWRFGDTERTERALASAAHVVTAELRNHRIVINAMEPRGAMGRFEAATGHYRLVLSSQNIHVIRDHIAAALGAGPEQVHVTAPDVGGGFGVRNFVYAEYVLVAWAARLTGRTVKWVNARSDGFVSDHQARDFAAHATLGLDASGRFTGLRIVGEFNLGAYLVGAGGGVPTGQYCACPGSVYDIGAVDLGITAVLTNTVPIGVTRGPGFAEMVAVMERLIDVAARETGIDRWTLRRRNLLRAEQMPWTNAVGTRIDSGDFLGCFERALTMAEADGFAARRDEARRRGVLLGLGVANHVKATGGLDEENIELAFRDGRLVLTTGTQAIGQGHETTFRQLLGTLLGLPFADIDYVAGDTDAIAMGGGHGSSRATYMAATAMHMGAERLLSAARPHAARMLEAAQVDLEFASDRFVVSGTDRSVGLLEVAGQAAARGEPLDTYQHFRREAMTFPSGCHVAEVAVDPDTGRATLLRYTAVDDYGVLVNPRLVEGQLHGAIAQGVGQALLEQAVYDTASGQLLAGSFLDYALPRADDLATVRFEHRPTRCQTNPLGVKGCGEAGAIAGFPALANAIADALGERERPALAGVASPMRIWRQL